MRCAIVVTRTAPWPSAQGLERGEARADDGTLLRYVAGGPAGARRVVLLHGAPQSSYSWRRVLPLLTDRYRVVAPDLRGYGESELARTGYDLDTLSGDLGTLIAHVRRGPDDRVLLVAHDWGGPIAWHYAERAPDSLRHLVAVNAPHGGAFTRELLHPRQAVRSWYIGLFQVPRLERAIEATRASFFLWMMTASSPRGTFTEEDLAHYRAELTRPGRCEAVLAYYRDAFGGSAQGGPACSSAGDAPSAPDASPSRRRSSGATPTPRSRPRTPTQSGATPRASRSATSPASATGYRRSGPRRSFGRSRTATRPPEPARAGEESPAAGCSGRRRVDRDRFTARMAPLSGRGDPAVFARPGPIRRQKAELHRNVERTSAMLPSRLPAGQRRVETEVGCLPT